MSNTTRQTIHEVNIPSNIITAALKFADGKDIRPLCQHVHIHRISHNDVRVIATNGHTLFIAEVTATMVASEIALHVNDIPKPGKKDEYVTFSEPTTNDSPTVRISHAGSFRDAPEHSADVAYARQSFENIARGDWKPTKVPQPFAATYVALVGDTFKTLKPGINGAAVHCLSSSTNGARLFASPQAPRVAVLVMPIHDKDDVHLPSLFNGLIQ